jgi:hypothetical protein
LLSAALVVATPGAVRAQAPATADVDRARELFVQATEMRDAGDARGALEKFKAARDLAPNPVTAIELGRTYSMLGMLLEARDAFVSVAHLPVQPEETPRATQARQDAAKLADDANGEIDRLIASAAPRPGASTPAEPTPAPAASAPPASSGRGMGPLAYAGFGVGIAGFVTGGVLLTMAISNASSAQDACSSTTGCPPSAADDLNSARGLGYTSIVAFGVAGMGIAVGIVDLLMNPPRSKDSCTSAVRVAPWIAPGGAGLTGSF